MWVFEVNEVNSVEVRIDLFAIVLKWIVEFWFGFEFLVTLLVFMNPGSYFAL